MRNISVANFQSRRLNNLVSCEAFCFDCQTLYAYDRGVITKYEESNEEIICRLRDTLYPESDCENDEISKVVELMYHFERNLLYLTLSNGDIISIETKGGGTETIVGSVDDGIKAAQWSPEQDLIALINGIDNLIVITNDFEPVSEVNLHSGDLGEKQIISVGWGRKETQFQGSVGKYNPNEQPENITFAKNHNIRISWRGDAEYFAVSSVNPNTNLRYLRIYSKNGILQYTSDPLAGVEDCLDWRPSGNLIASTQKLPNKYNVCFFEKNGMKHGEFTLPVNCKNANVNEISWSKDSRILAISVTDTSEECNKRCIHLYTVNNYKWYCKYTINIDTLGTPLCMKWDHQKLNTFHIVLKKENFVYHYKYSWIWVTNKSLGNNVEDESFVAVIDGCYVHLTSFKREIIPPPMCSYIIKLKSPVNSVSFAPDSSNDLLVLLSDGTLHFYKYIQCSSDPFKIGHKFINSLNSFSNESELCYNFQWVGTKKIMLCMVNTKTDAYESKPFLNVIDIEDLNGVINYQKKEIPLESPAAIIRASKSAVVVYDNAGKFHSFSENSLSETSLKINKSIIELEVIKKEDGNLFVISLDRSDKFYINSKLIFNNILSFHVHDKFILLTNMKHELLCLNCDESILNVDSLSEVFKRKVERGSRLVTSVQKDMKVILQMPRGNLECIQPRVFSIYSVAKYLNELNYAEAFNVMRKQRINLNLIYDHSPTLFSNNVTTFVEQVKDPQWISLFMSELIEEDVTKTMYAMAYKERKNEQGETLIKSKIATVCDLMEKALSSRENSENYLLPMLTSHIKRGKIEFLEAALLKLKNLKERELQGVKSSVSFDQAFKYILYLIDVEELYRIALGMYDFDLALIVANKSHKDPKEYLPFLNELKKLESHYQRYTIDKYLKRYKKALASLIECEGEDAFDECINFIKAHKLYKDALKLISPNAKMFKTVCLCYGEELVSSHHFEEAGIVFSIARLHERAIEAFRKSGNWQEVLNHARELKLEENQLRDLYWEIAEDLVESKEYAKSAVVYLDYLKDAEECVRVLANGNQFAEAYRICHLHNRMGLIDGVIVPAILYQGQAMLSHVANLREKFRRQRDRLRVVRKKNLEDSETRKDEEFESDAYSEASTALTGSYATSRSTNRTYRSAKNRRKQERKLLSLKEGSPHENLALVISLHDLVTSSIGLMPEIKEINRFLLKINRYELAEKLQLEFDDFLKEIEFSKSEIWIPELLQNNQRFGPNATSNEIASSYPNSSGGTSNLFNPKYAIPPETKPKLKWKLEILNS